MANNINSAGLMAREFDLAFPNREKLMIFADNHYVNRLNTAQFCSSLQQSPHASSIVGNFIYKSSYLHTEHLLMETRLKSMNGSFIEQLNSIAVSKKVYSVLFNAAAMICAVNAIPVSERARAVVGAAGAAASILFGALGRWRQSALKKRETAVNKHKGITEHMCAGAKTGMKHLLDIHQVGIRLYLETEALSEAIHDGEKDTFEELLRNDEAYSKSMETVKQDVLVILS